MRTRTLDPGGVNRYYEAQSDIDSLSQSEVITVCAQGAFNSASYRFKSRPAHRIMQGYEEHRSVLQSNTTAANKDTQACWKRSAVRVNAIY